MDSGKAVTPNMTGRQNQGMYTTLRRSHGRWRADPTRTGEEGLIVRTLTPERKSRAHPAT